jgi:ADP-ribose pyrophosphatase
MNMKKWRLLKSDTVLSTRWLSIFKNRYEIAEGQVLDDYYIVKRDDFVLIVALQDDKLILVRQYRPANDRFYLGLPAGFLEPGERPEAGAKRELLEETGFRATECSLIGELDPLPGYLQSKAFVFLCETSAANTGTFDQLEIEEVVEVAWDDALQMILHGEMNEIPTIAAILLAKEVLASHG